MSFPFWALVLLSVTGETTNNTSTVPLSMSNEQDPYNSERTAASSSEVLVTFPRSSGNHAKSTNSPNSTQLDYTRISQQAHTQQCPSTETVNKNEDGRTQKWLLSAAFLVGAFSSSILFSTFFFVICLIQRLKQQKLKVQDEEQKENLKITKSDEQLLDAEEVKQEEQVLNEEPPLDESGEALAAADKGTSGVDAVAKEVDYATIDYSLLKEREEAKGVEGKREPEYAEIKQEEVRKEVEKEQLTVEKKKLDEEIQELAGQEEV